MSSPDTAVRIIEDAYKARSLTIEPQSELLYLLAEVTKYQSATGDLQPGATDAATDVQAVAVAGTLLRAIRLADSLEALIEAGTPKLTETLKTLASFDHGNAEHESQFDESEYELHAASQFLGFGQTVAFVHTKSPSRYQQHVEFMLGYKWPVECKRPRSEGQILSNLRKAVAKIDERQQPGIACVALEAALPMNVPFLEVENTEDTSQRVAQHVWPWLDRNRKEIETILSNSWTRFLMMTYVVRTYVHATEEVGLPSLLLGFSSTAAFITTQVPSACIQALQQERERAGQRGA